jgi:Tol biopolymer transport system component
MRRLIVPLLGLATILLMAQPAGATYPGRPGRIAFFDLFGRKGSEIYTIASDGSDKQQLTPDRSASSVDPAWSPDGSKIAFEGHQNGCGPCIFTMNADGSHTQIVASFENRPGIASAEHPTWSPDMSKIAFCAVGPRYSSSRIYVVGVDGTGLTNLSGKAHDADCEPEWSPDGSLIAFDDLKTFTIATMQPDGSNRTVIIDSHLRPRNPTWSPDSLRLLFSGRLGARNNIYSAAADRSDIQQLTDTPNRWEWQAVYSPNGNRIVFNRSQKRRLSSPDDLWKMRTDGSGQHPLTRTVNIDEWGPDWQPT